MWIPSLSLFAELQSLNQHLQEKAKRQALQVPFPFPFLSSFLDFFFSFLLGFFFVFISELLWPPAPDRKGGKNQVGSGQCWIVEEVEGNAAEKWSDVARLRAWTGKLSEHTWILWDQLLRWSASSFFNLLRCPQWHLSHWYSPSFFLDFQSKERQWWPFKEAWLTSSTKPLWPQLSTRRRD